MLQGQRVNLQPSGNPFDIYYLVSEFLPCCIRQSLLTQSANAIMRCTCKPPNVYSSTLTKIAAAREKIKLHPLKVLALNTL